jgi:hypothetical protein
LLYAQTGSAITTSTHTIILLPFNQDNSAITIASSLQLIVESLFLLRNEGNSETMAPSLLLFCIKDAPAIMTASLANFSLQLIVDIFCKISFHFCEDYRIFCEGEYQYQDANGHQELTKLISGLIKHNGLIGRIIGCNGLINLVGLNSLDGIIGLVGFGLNGLDGFDSIIGIVGFIGLGFGLVGHTGLVGLNSLDGIIGLVGFGLNGLDGFDSIISLVGRIVDRNGLIGLISLVDFGVISFVGLICIISLVGLSLNGLIGRIGFIGLGISDLGMISLVGSSASFARQLIGFIGLGIKCLISLVRLNGHISLVDLGRTSLTSIVGLIGLIGRIGLNGHNDGVGLVNKVKFEIPCYSFVREGWLWCVRRLCSLARLDSDFFFRHALQYAKQLFYSRFPQVTKYFVMRECEDSYTESLCCDSAFAHKKKFYIFKFPKRFSEIS